MYLVHIYAYPYKYTYIQVLMAQNSCISQPYGEAALRFPAKAKCKHRCTMYGWSLVSSNPFLVPYFCVASYPSSSSAVSSPVQQLYMTMIYLLATKVAANPYRTLHGWHHPHVQHT